MGIGRRFAVAFLVFVVATGVFLAPPGVFPAQADDELVEITFSEPMPLEEFLKGVAQLGLPLAWDPQDKAIKGKTIQGGRTIRITKEHLLSSVRALLTFFDLVIVPSGSKGGEVLMVMDFRQTTTILRLKPVAIELTPENLGDYEGQDGLFVTTILSAPHMGDLRDARNALSRIITGQNIGNVQEVPPGTFVITDFAPNVVAAFRLVALMDVQAAKRAASEPVRTVRLEHAQAADLAALLSVQFDAATAPPQPAKPPTAASSLRIQGDSRTNALLVSGPSDVVARVLEVVKALDVPGRDDDPPAKADAVTPKPDVRERLKTLKVSLDVEAQPLEEVLRTLEEAAHVQIVVTPAARTTAFYSATITLNIHDVAAEKVLELICPAGSCQWRVEDEIVYVTDAKGR